MTHLERSKGVCTFVMLVAVVTLTPRESGTSCFPRSCGSVDFLTSFGAVLGGRKWATVVSLTSPSSPGGCVLSAQEKPSLSWAQS